MNLADMTALELGAAIKKGEISAVEAAKFSLGQIDKYDSRFSCFVTVQDDVLQRAEEVQQKIASGEYTSPLAGVPMGMQFQAHLQRHRRGGNHESRRGAARQAQYG